MVQQNLTPETEKGIASHKAIQLWAVPLMLLLLCVLSYGLLIGSLGFYWDDWQMVWAWHSQGRQGLIGAFADRPFLGWLYAITTPLLGENPLGWHVVALFARWLSAVALWWLLRALWPNRERENACIAFLFAVYPGFTGQPIAYIYSHVFLILTVFIFSLGAMIRALRSGRRFWLFTTLALLASLMSMMTVEYFFGLELLRPVLLWIVVAETTTGARLRLRRVLKYWSPYLAGMMIFLIWRLVLFKSPRASTDQIFFLRALMNQPVAEFATRLRYVFTDVAKTSLLAWAQTFHQDIFAFESRSVWIALALVLIVALAITLYLVRVKSAKEHIPVGLDQLRWAKQAIGLGLLAIVLGQTPFWFSNREVQLNSLFDRYALPAMFGSAILLFGLIEASIRTRLQRAIIVGVIVGLAVGFHFRNASRFRQDWLAQNSLVWQLSWRAPALKPGTSVLLPRIEPPLSFTGEFALAVPLNLVYASKHSSAQLDYWLFNAANRDLVKGRDLEASMRGASFSGTSSESLVVVYSPPSCLHVLDPAREERSQLTAQEQDLRLYSHVDQIVGSADSQARPPAAVFLPEPRGSWCYYFEQADLARQNGDWKRVTELGDEAHLVGLKASDATEWLPFIEGYFKVGRYEDAQKASERVADDARARAVLCRLLTGFEGSGSTNALSNSSAAEMKTRMSCSGL